MKATGGDFNTRGQEDEIVERLRRMESEIKKDLGGASLLHGAKDESHESLVTGVIATVVLVIVLLMLSSFGGKSKLD